MHRFINILLNNCDYISDRLSSEKRYQDACRDPTMASGLELRRQFVAPLAKRVSSATLSFSISLYIHTSFFMFKTRSRVFLHMYKEMLNL